MLVGVPKEIKVQEHRVGLVPGTVRELIHHGHEVVVETLAGHAIGLEDEDYRHAGARIANSAEELFGEAELVVKVKEPLASERALLRPGQILFTYLHLAADAAQTRELVESGATAIAYETVTDPAGRLPLLAPMSEVAGRMSIQAGAHCLEREVGGRGVLLGGVAGVPAADVVIIGGGVVGTSAARMAIGLEARVTILDKSVTRLQQLDTQFGATLNTIFATTDAVEQHVRAADLVIGAVLVPGAETPRLIKAADVAAMRRGSVIVDVAIDQGGISETSRPTTHDNPTYLVDEVVHYCVANMPGAVARTATFALNNATLPYLLALADRGWAAALAADPGFAAGLNVHAGEVTHPAVAKILGYSYTPPEKAIAAAA